MDALRSQYAAPRGLAVALCCTGLWACTALLGCAPDPKPIVFERLTVHIDSARAQAQIAKPGVLRSELDGTWVVQDTRDAVPSAFGEPVVFPVNARGAGNFAFGFSVEGCSASKPGEVGYEVRLRARGRETLLVDTRAQLEDAAQTWVEAHVLADLGSAGDAELECVVRWLGAEAPPAGARPLHAAPRVVAARGGRRNVLVISIDTLRADHLGFHGYERATSPNLDAFVKTGAVFERAISTAPWTLPSYGTLFTGLEPARHRAGISARREAAFGSGEGVPGADYQSLVPDVPTLAGTLAAQGYLTKAFASNPFLDPASNIDRGFDSFVQYLNRAQAGVDLATKWITAQGDAPWFLFLHLMDPHMPYTPPAPYDTRFSKTSLRAQPGHPHSIESLRAGPPSAELQQLLVDSYDGEIAYTDAQIGRLFDALRQSGVLEHTIVVIHSDHGEEFWEHGGFEHGHTLYDEILHVPLAIVAPGLVAPGLRIGARTSTVHAFATLLDLAGLPVPEHVGASLADELRPVDPTPASARDVCISEAILGSDRESKSWSRGMEKFVTDGVEWSLLFDLAADPGERTDLAPANAERVRQLRELLLRRARDVAELGVEESPAAFDRDRRADLERLGYPGGDTADEPK